MKSIWMNNLKGVLGVKRIYKLRNVESILKRFGHVIKMYDCRLAREIYSGGCVGN